MTKHAFKFIVLLAALLLTLNFSFSVHSENRALGSLRQLDGNEVFFRIKIVLARLIDHSKLSQFCSRGIGDDTVELSQLERSGKILILDAYNEV